MERLAKLGFLDRVNSPGLPRWFGDRNATHYQVLGVSNLATSGQIDAAFLKLTFTWNPLVCRLPRSEEVFARIAEAHQVLSEPSARWQYDLSLLPAVERPALAPESAHPAVAAYQKAAWSLHGSDRKFDIEV